MNKVYDWAELRRRLADCADDEYREFSMKGIFSERPFIGVRIPQIRRIVAEVPKEKIEEILAVEPVAIEEVLAQGMLIGRLPYEEIVAPREHLHGGSWFDSQISYIDNWCTCDIFCSGMAKKIRKKRTEFFETKVDGLLSDKSGEFAVRVGLVLLKSAYIEPEWLNVIFDRVDGLAEREEYYIRMGIAWLLCDCFIKYPTATTGYMVSSKLPVWTFNKTISKICDSYRVDDETKDLVRKMRKKI